jgi:hypothetical protein
LIRNNLANSRKQPNKTEEEKHHSQFTTTPQDPSQGRTRIDIQKGSYIRGIGGKLVFVSYYILENLALHQIRGM